ncbi:hypothetical protein C9374_009352 [Naegleria lovaniensis]|uniref:protein-tyrosine-phosphatase n=1 Tax=Naegleria lovaniensis TaxID=51637 RepID=A0AA88KGR9_NAELO|nr:uncharacterized protein C9374_009352 [Naegleria lovaniensis]KAG2377441.1 hypothetical protein C9374_009352 [Naegleria lovaniensis]
MSYFANKPSTIIESKLYLGAFGHARRWPGLEKLNIKGVINCTSEIPNYFEKHDGMCYLRVEVDDRSQQNISKYFDETFQFIEQMNEQNKAVLVHCAAGISRSSTICIAYLMRKFNITLREAFFIVKKARSTVLPNEGFFKQLLELEKQLRGSNSFAENDYYTLNEMSMMYIGNFEKNELNTGLLLQ